MELFGDGAAREKGRLNDRANALLVELATTRGQLAVRAEEVKRLHQALTVEQSARSKAEARAKAAEHRYHELADKALEMKREGFAVPDAPPTPTPAEGAEALGLPQEFVDAVVEVYGSARHPMARKDLTWAELELRKTKNNPEMVPVIARKIQEGAEHE